MVTTRGTDGIDQGMTVSAFTSVSLVPPLILICIEKNASVHGALTTSTQFVVNILAVDQEQIARRFSIVDIDRFEGVGYSRSHHGIAVLDDVLGVLYMKDVSRRLNADPAAAQGVTVEQVMRPAVRQERGASRQRVRVASSGVRARADSSRFRATSAQSTARRCNR